MLSMFRADFLKRMISNDRCMKWRKLAVDHRHASKPAVYNARLCADAHGEQRANLDHVNVDL